VVKGGGGADSEVLMGTQSLLNQIIAINQSGPAPHSLHTYISKIIKSTRQKGMEGKDHRNRVTSQVPVCVLHIVGVVVPTINVPVCFYGAVRDDFDADKSISRAIGRDGP
jgi:hypothetical protein